MKKYLYIFLSIFFVFLYMIFFIIKIDAYIDGTKDNTNYDDLYDEFFDCKYLGKIEQCLDNQKSIRKIENFVCINGTKEEIIYQIVLDEKFKEVDKKIEQFISDLENAKDIYFGKNKQYNFTEGIDLIDKKLGINGEFDLEYKALCSLSGGGIIADTMECLDGKSTISEVRNQLNGGSVCFNLYKTKLAVYYSVANNVLKNNKAKIMKDNHKKFTQIQRTKYDKLIDMIMINISYIERMWSKWGSKTETVYK